MEYILSREWVKIDGGNIDCAIYHPTSLPAKKTPVLLVCGWSSGWTGIRLIAIFLVRLGYSVIVPSVPGYGESFTPPRKDWGQNGFEKEALWIHSFWEAIRKDEGWTECYFVGHSTGCQIGVAMANKWPGCVSKIVLLSPSGLEKISGFWNKLCFTARFFWSAYQHDRAFKRKNNENLQTLWNQSVKDETGPFWPWLRLQQRLDEFRRLCQGELGQTLLGPNFPILGENVLIMTGTRDIVFGEVIIRLRPVFREIGVEVITVDGGYHNLTKLLADQVAVMISRFLGQ